MTLENIETISDISELHNKIRNCNRCDLCSNRINAVPGKGNPDTDIMFTGEGPGSEEDKQGIPFAGKAGPILDELLEVIHETREEVFISNCVNCRPPANRDPSKQEIMACAPYLCQYISLIHPRVICTLGRVATNNVFRMMGMENQIESIGRMNGNIYPSALNSDMSLVPLYHPASVFYDSTKKDILLRDIKSVKEAACPF